jgi:imidazoleglycerol-phosphate dehydratase
MSAEQNPTQGEPAVTYVRGEFIGPEGGEIDTTVRPTRLPRHILDKLKAEAGVDTPAMRHTTIERQTAETKIRLQLSLDGTGQANIATGIGFFDHMLTLLAKHSLVDLTAEAQGDLHVDAHHTVEDVGICFGKALVQALGDKAGIRRYGSATLPMDEVLVTAAVDLSGRPFCIWQADLPGEMLGTFNAPLAEEFWRAVSASGLCNLHVLCHHGKNSHHIVEAIFKACARALRHAVEMDPRMPGIPSTKGVL